MFAVQSTHVCNHFLSDVGVHKNPLRPIPGGHRAAQTNSGGFLDLNQIYMTCTPRCEDWIAQGSADK